MREIEVGLEFSELCSERRHAKEALWQTTLRAPSRPGKQQAAVRTGRRFFVGGLGRGHCGSWEGKETGERSVFSHERKPLLLTYHGCAADVTTPLAYCLVSAGST